MSTSTAGSTAGPTTTESLDRQIMEIRLELQHNAGLFDRPQAYIAGVEDTLSAIRRHAVEAAATTEDEVNR